LGRGVRALIFTQHMNFKDWMLYRGLSLSTAEKYAGAITGPLTDWGLNAGLLQSPLITLESPADYKVARDQLTQLPIFQERNQRGHGMYGSALEKYADFLQEGFKQCIESDITDILSDTQIPSTEKLELVKARIGQGKFRQMLMSHWNGCAVTQYQEFSMLLASHIKPWCASTHQERLDPFNGLLLIPNLDRAFDHGLISFDAKGSVLISPLLTDPAKLGITTAMKVALRAEHQPYMAHHRSNVFISS
jgi:putative restriction endonuclease